MSIERFCIRAAVKTAVVLYSKLQLISCLSSWLNIQSFAISYRQSPPRCVHSLLSAAYFRVAARVAKSREKTRKSNIDLVVFPQFLFNDSTLQDLLLETNPTSLLHSSHMYIHFLLLHETRFSLDFELRSLSTVTFRPLQARK